MGCHKIVAAQGNPEVQKVHEHWNQRQPIPWVRIHKLAGFVYFPHKRHVQVGLACQTCHGPVETMQRVAQVAPLTMGWCLDCHRRSQGTNPPRPPALGVPANSWSASLGLFFKVVARNRDVTRLTTCTACHR
jgi:hypothetical protein